MLLLCYAQTDTLYPLFCLSLFFSSVDFFLIHLSICQKIITLSDRQCIFHGGSHKIQFQTHSWCNIYILLRNKTKTKISGTFSLFFFSCTRADRNLMTHVDLWEAISSQALPSQQGENEHLTI